MTDAKKLTLAEKAEIRDGLYDNLAEMLQEVMNVGTTEITEGLLIQGKKCDMVIKVIIKNERVDVEDELEAIAEKAKAKAERIAKAQAKKAKDEAKRAKAKAEKEKGKE